MSVPPPAGEWPRAPLLLCSSSSRTGGVEALIALAAWLRSRGADARFGGDSVREGDLGGHLARAGVPWVRTLRLSRKARLADVLADARNLAAWARQGAPDLIQASMAHDGWLALWAARRAGAARDGLRVVRVAHRRADVEPGRLGVRLLALRRCDGVIVHAERYRERLLAAGLDPRRVRAIPGAVDASFFTPGPTALRARWGVPEDAPLAGIVARMKPDRGHEALLRGFALALREVPEARLVLVGRGEDEPRLRALAAELAPGRGLFGGYCRGEELRDAYRALDVAVWLREGNDGACRGVLEAMACGKPVIAGDDGAPAELVLPACGRVVDPSRPEAIAAALRELLSGLPAARALGAAARARALGFTVDRAGEATLAFWRELRALPPVERAPAVPAAAGSW